MIAYPHEKLTVLSVEKLVIQEIALVREKL